MIAKRLADGGGGGLRDRRCAISLREIRALATSRVLSIIRFRRRDKPKRRRDGQIEQRLIGEEKRGEDRFPRNKIAPSCTLILFCLDKRSESRSIMM